MPSNVDTTALLLEQRKQHLRWELADRGSREEYEAAEAATRAAAELDSALCDGADLPVEWQRPQYPDLDTLRLRIDLALYASMDRCARCKVCDTQIDAVMAVVQQSLSRGETGSREHD